MGSVPLTPTPGLRLAWSLQVATGGDDHSVRIWDLRQRTCGYTLPAHLAVVSEVRYAPQGHGEVMLTTSFDGKIRLWGTRDFRMLNNLAGHEGKVMGGGEPPNS